jgi:hypothetical protein
MTHGRWLLFVLALPWTLTVSYPLLWLFWVFGLAQDLRWSEYGVLTATWSDKAAKYWFYSTTIGHGIVFYPGAREDVRVVRHEDVHVRQAEDNALLAFLLFLLIASCGHLGLALFVWWSHGTWPVLCYVASGLRYGWAQDSVYRNAENERSAYAQTDVFKRETPSSWEDRQSGV